MRQRRTAGRLESGEPARDLPTRRRWQRGPLTFFNQLPKREPAVESIPLVAEALEGAVVSARSFQAGPAGTAVPQTYAGAIYRNDGTILPEFVRLEQQQAQNHSVLMRNPRELDPARMAAAAPVDRTCIYLGDLRRHFGHFLLESLSRAWYLEERGPRPFVIFHGDAHVRASLGSCAHAMFQALDVDPARIILAHEDLHVRELIVPRAQYQNTVMGSPGMCIAFDHMRERILKTRPGLRPLPGQVYFSRRNLAPERLAGGVRRSFANEEEAEAVFRRRGYEILSPENLPFEEQVAIAANATHVAGLSGSALHLVLFNSRPGTKVIELRTKSAWNQQIINRIRGVQGFHIWCVARRVLDKETVLDIPAIEQALASIP